MSTSQTDIGRRTASPVESFPSGPHRIFVRDNWSIVAHQDESGARCPASETMFRGAMESQPKAVQEADLVERPRDALTHGGKY